MTQPTIPLPSCLAGPAGLQFEFNANGSIRRMLYRDIVLNLFPGNELEGGPANLYLRRIGGDAGYVPLLGPLSPAGFAVQGNRFVASGVWQGLRFQAVLVLVETAPAWFWHVALENLGPEPVTVDLIYAQDLALAPYAAIRMNEYYVSQYLDHTPLTHTTQGLLVATRQNQAVAGRNPWCLIGALGQGVSFATDARQVQGLAGRAGHAPEGLAQGLPAQRWQHEHAMAAIQDEALTLAPGQGAQRGFFGWLEEHHPAATGASDLPVVDRLLALPERNPPPAFATQPLAAPASTLFTTCPALSVLDLADPDLNRLFDQAHREEERDNGQLLSFFTGHRQHVVLRAKELTVLRPHGHILRTGSALTPDEAALTSTVWMDGVFHSMVTQGHVSINRLLSTTHSYLGLFRSHGQRVFIETADGWRRLAIPSAFAMSPEACRWIYRHPGGLLEVCSQAATERHDLSLRITVLEGEPVRCLIAHHVALNGDDGAEAYPAVFAPQGEGVWIRAIPDSDVGRRFPDGGFLITPAAGTVIERLGGDDMLFTDGQSRRQPYLCLVTAPARMTGLSITGHLVEPDAGRSVTADPFWQEATAGLTIAPDALLSARRLVDSLPWFAHNALIHYLAPRGLEQYSGGGWGTRDVSQGPVEYLLAIGQFPPLQDLLLRVFRQQNPDGDWPQWFMFFERERNIRPGDAHGDIVFWPLLALAQYLSATGDGALLKEPTPFFHAEPDQAEQASLWQHVERALELIQSRMIPGTHLAAYGHGDWNDALQPADPSLRERLCSAWTVTLHYQMLTTLAQALGNLGQAEAAGVLETLAAEVLADFRRLLFVDGVVAGYAWFAEEGRIDYLVHPRDRRTGLSYSLLPMMHAVITDMLEPAEALQQLDLIREHLTGPDGAHLFDRPMLYRGGTMTLFQRAESSSFFGREIGNLYTHAHLRYAEALWHVGDAEGFFAALSQAAPIDIQSVVASAARRQANCYYSSSDAAFRDRYQAQEQYGAALAGQVPLEGGWRVYSSGAGIATSLILRGLLGIRPGRAALVIDPVMPRALDGLQVELDIAGERFAITYHVGGQGSGPVVLTLNGAALPFQRQNNPCRTGGAVVSLPLLLAMRTPGVNALKIALE